MSKSLLKKVEFAVYAGDTFVAAGTAFELAKKFGVNPATIRFMSTPSYFKRIAQVKHPTGRAKYAIKIAD